MTLTAHPPPPGMSGSWAALPTGSSTPLPTGSSTYLNSLIHAGTRGLNSISKAGRPTGYVADGRGVLARSTAALDGRGAGDEPQEQPYMAM